ncbi:hypothetical protein GMMP15_1030056 [Candidatus Magnetomoraceae bacterium gMMP-15]
MTDIFVCQIMLFRLKFMPKRKNIIKHKILNPGSNIINFNPSININPINMFIFITANASLEGGVKKVKNILPLRIATPEIIIKIFNSLLEFSSKKNGIAVVSINERVIKKKLITKI